MSFWNLSSGEQVKTDGNFESGGGDMTPIPDGTSVLAIADEAKWDSFNDGPQFISIRWSVMAPQEYKNRKIFQKLWVGGNNPHHKDPAKQGDSHKRMLAAIDANAGGKLFASGEAPTDDSMTRFLCNKPMVLKLGVWEMEVEGQSKSGNWIQAVSPRNGGAAQKKVEPKKQEEKPEAPEFQGDDDLDPDIPF